MLNLNVLIPLSLILLTEQNVKFVITVFLSMICGYILRLSRDWWQNKATWKLAIVQLVNAICLTTIGVILWEVFNINMNIVVYVMLVSYFSLFILDEWERFFKMKFKQWLKNIIGIKDDGTRN